jgi:hypothetical protein
MADRTILLQRVIIQRTEPPDGLRIWSDGLVQRSSDDNPLPDPTERLDKDRDLKWEDDQRISAHEVDTIRSAIRNSGFFGLEPQLLINYCKEDPGAAIWTVNVGDESARVVLWDPKPKRSATLEALSGAIDKVLTP